MSRHRHARPIPNWLPREPALNPWIDQNMRRLQGCRDEHGEDYPNADNERVAQVGHREDEQRYAEIKAMGCCGYLDVEVKHRASGRVFRFGFNYGH